MHVNALVKILYFIYSSRMLLNFSNCFFLWFLKIFFLKFDCYWVMPVIACFLKHVEASRNTRWRRYCNFVTFEWNLGQQFFLLDHKWCRIWFSLDLVENCRFHFIQWLISANLLHLKSVKRLNLPTCEIDTDSELILIVGWCSRLIFHVLH